MIRKMLIGLAAIGASSLQAEARDLTIVTVGAPEINCVFDQDCRITVSDFSAPIVLSGVAGEGFLQSRTQPPGETGTPGAGLYAYEYRVEVSHADNAAGIVNCVNGLTVPFGDIARLDYNGDGVAEDVYVITRGALGAAAPITATQAANGDVTFDFGDGVCGVSTFFFGVASRAAPAQRSGAFVDFYGAPTTIAVTSPDTNTVIIGGGAGIGGGLGGGGGAGAIPGASVNCAFEFPTTEVRVQVPTTPTSDVTDSLRAQCEQCEARGDLCWIKGYLPAVGVPVAACAPPDAPDWQVTERLVDLLCYNVAQGTAAYGACSVSPQRVVSREQICAPAGQSPRSVAFEIEEYR